MLLAADLITQYHNATEALKAGEYYIRVIQNKELPAAHEFTKVVSREKSPTLTSLLKELKCFSTTGDVRNAIDGRSIVVE
jgi:hypothetical protein